MRKSAGVAVGFTLVCVLVACVLLVAGPARAQSGEQLFAQAEKALANGENAEAVDLYSKAIRSAQLAKQTLAEAFLKRGRAQQLTGKHARAVADFTNALWLESLGSADVARAHGWRGASRQALGQEKLAKDDFAKARDIDPQFAAGPVPPPAADGASGTAVAGGQPTGASSAQSSGGSLLGRIFGGESETASTSGQRAARRSDPPPPREPQPAPSADSEGPGLLARIFGPSDGASTETARADSGVTVQRLDPPTTRGDAPIQQPAPPTVSNLAPPAAVSGPSTPPAQSPDILTQILTGQRSAAADDNTVRPRAKPSSVQATGNADQPSGPTRLTGPAVGDAGPRSDQSAQAVASAQTAERPGLLERIFGPADGGSARAPALAVPAPAPRPAPASQQIVRDEPVSVSESRVASAPPWRLGADNASASEERASLPPTPSAGRSGFLSPTRTASSNETRRRPTRLVAAAQPAPPPATEVGRAPQVSAPTTTTTAAAGGRTGNPD